MFLNVFAGGLALLSLALALWQWLAARRFPLHQRSPCSRSCPGASVLKPLKGCDAATEGCLESWFTQDYQGDLQILFAVASAADPVCAVVNRLMRKFPSRDVQLVACSPLSGANAKVSKLAILERLAKFELVLVSDADVAVPPDLVANMAAQLDDPAVGLVNCLYRLGDAPTWAMKLEAIGTNADFWSQVLQSRDLKPMGFALGAVMATRRKQLTEIGGFQSLVDCLADDYQLGHRIAARGYRIELSPVVVECLSAPLAAADVWKHQLRWARTIRVCQPLPYFLSVLSNPTLWPLVWAAICPGSMSLVFLGLAAITRCWMALDLQRRIAQKRVAPFFGILAPIKDLFQALLWLMAHLGNRIEWRGVGMRLRKDGTLVRGGVAQGGGVETRCESSIK